MNWNNVVTKVGPHVVKIETQSGFGTGFLCAYSENRVFCGIATALHVVFEADRWQQPLRIHGHDFKKSVLLKEPDRIIFPDYDNDSAVILVPHPEHLGLPQTLIQLRPIETPLGIGIDVGWLGFPGLEPLTLCFFSGNISARKADRSAYLVDGVAINGVSGGPVLHSDGTDGVQFVGVVTAYRANRMTGETLPGLLVAQDVSHLHSVIQQIRDRDDAIKKRAELKQDRPPTAPPSAQPPVVVIPARPAKVTPSKPAEP
jgi:hypothetical protein